MKTIGFIFSFWVGTLTIHAQSIEDYFVPQSVNKTTFSVPQSSVNRAIYYLKKDTALIVMDSSFIGDRFYTAEIRTLKLTTNEVRIVKSVSSMSSGSITNEFDSAQVILKMPAKGQTTNWFFFDHSGEKINCTSSWTRVQHKGEELKAIKLEKLRDGLSVKEVEYYVQGLGFWKAEVVTSGQVLTKAHFEEEILVPGLE